MKTRKLLLFTALLSMNCFVGYSQDTPAEERRMDIYGFVMMDAGYNAGQIHPDWYDVVRPTKLSSFKDEYGPDGNFFMSVRQTRFGVKGYTPTKMGT